MSVKVESTTDTPEQVAAASGVKPELAAPEKEVAAPAEVVKAKPAVPEAGEPEVEGNSETPEAAAKKKPGGFQKKIDKLTRRNSDLEVELASYRSRNAEPPKPEASLVSKPTVEGKPDPKNFERHSDYVEALTDWKVDQKLNSKEAEAKDAANKNRETEAVKAWAERVVAAKQRYDDFDDVMSEDVPVSATTRDLLLESDVGPDIAYYLGTHVDEAIAISRMSPLNAAKAIGRIEALLVEEEEEEAAPVTEIALPVQKPKAKPKPVEPTGGGSGPAMPKSPENMTFKEFKAWRNSSRSTSA